MTMNDMNPSNDSDTAPAQSLSAQPLPPRPAPQSAAQSQTPMPQTPQYVQPGPSMQPQYAGQPEACDYYQPEAYIPSTDTYIEKDLAINDEIDKLRLAATSSTSSGRSPKPTIIPDLAVIPLLAICLMTFKLVA